MIYFWDCPTDDHYPNKEKQSEGILDWPDREKR